MREHTFCGLDHSDSRPSVRVCWSYSILSIHVYRLILKVHPIRTSRPGTIIILYSHILQTSMDSVDLVGAVATVDLLCKMPL